MRESQLRFIRQLGYTTPHPDLHLYTALMLQPRIVGAVTTLGILLQSPWLFLGLFAALWWSALIPTHSLFDAIYNYGVADRRGLPRLAPAPEPRRFAGGMAAAVALAISLAILVGATAAAWVFEGLLAVASAAVVFRRVCAGAALYHVLHGNTVARRQQSV